MLKKKSKVKNTKDDMQSISSPYLNARREWNERYGDYIAIAKRWRLFAMFSILLACICVFGVIYFASQNKLIPYVVEVDKRGATVTVYKNTQMRDINPVVVKAQLGQFIRDLRTVSADMTVQKQAINRLYTHLDNVSQATTVINQFFTNNTPFKRAEKVIVSIDIKQILPLSEKTWQVEWSEHTFGRDGKSQGVKNYTATMTVSIGNQISEQSILLNPIGLMIEEIHWSEDLKQN